MFFMPFDVPVPRRWRSAPSRDASSRSKVRALTACRLERSSASYWG